ncbi:MAG TPA: metal-dependent hydrolase [Beutenbergiaceae bacterium]|nr:metal-dependent hydrolase [Beutenbergiaceae bacterium]
MTTVEKTHQAVPVRRVRFRFGDPKPMNHFFVENDIVLSHFVAFLTAVFPPGEESFIRSVRAFSDEITDPELKKRVAGFIGQESVHGQEHRRLNEQLADLGYPIVRLCLFDKDSRRQRFVHWLENRVSPYTHLAWTAAAEHYTATLAKRVLSSDEIQALPNDPEIRHLLNWHAIEESEHRDVAFDVYQAVGGTEEGRIRVMRHMYYATIPVVAAAVTASVVTDPRAVIHPFKALRQAYNLARGPIVRGLMKEIKVYMRPGFHPLDIDTSDLEAEWRERLFGDEENPGEIYDRLHTGKGRK